MECLRKGLVRKWGNHQYTTLIFYFGQTFPPKQNAVLYFVCVLNESHFVSKAPNGINEEKQYEHVCSINSVIIGSCESLFISILRANLAQRTDEK